MNLLMYSARTLLTSINGVIQRGHLMVRWVGVNIVLLNCQSMMRFLHVPLPSTDFLIFVLFFFLFVMVFSFGPFLHLN